MKKVITKGGLIAYKTTSQELQLIGGLGICDECNTAPGSGYLVPVLNHWMCDKCYEDWQRRAKRYPEDDPIEQKNARYYEAMIPLEK